MARKKKVEDDKKKEYKKPRITTMTYPEREKAKGLLGLLSFFGRKHQEFDKDDEAQ